MFVDVNLAWSFVFIALGFLIWKILENTSKTHWYANFLQLNVRNKSAARECYIRTEICLEGLRELSHLSLASRAFNILLLISMHHFPSLVHQHKEATLFDTKPENTNL